MSSKIAVRKGGCYEFDHIVLGRKGQNGHPITVFESWQLNNLDVQMRNVKAKGRNVLPSNRAGGFDGEASVEHRVFVTASALKSNRRRNIHGIGEGFRRQHSVECDEAE